MAFEDKLRSALDIAVKHYNDGCTPDEACCKTACACGFNRDQADRLVEVMNTAITINQYKQAEDRAADFPIAHKDRVAAMMLDADTVLGIDKKAEKAPNVYFEYMSPAPARRRKGVQLEKAASAPAENNVYAGMSVENVTDLAVREISMKKRAAAYAKETAGSIHGQLVTDLYELADDIRKSGTEDYAVFKQACESKDIVDRLDRILPESFSSVRPAEGFVDDTKVAEFVDRADSMHRSYEFMKELLRKEAALAKRASDMQEQLLSACGVSGVTKEAASLGDVIKIPYSLTVGRKGPSDAGVLSSMNRKLLDAEQSESSDVEETTKNTDRSILLQYLLSTDSVLREMDPSVVASGYNTLLRVAPDVASDPELVRSILRQTSQSVAISPFDAEVWAKLNGRMNGKKMEA